MYAFGLKVSLKMRKALNLLIALLVALSFIFLVSCDSEKADPIPSPVSETPVVDNSRPVVNGDKVDVLLWVMSECPYGKGAENAVNNLMKALKDNVNLSVKFIVDDLGDGKFKSLHGQPEVELNKVQACAGILDKEKSLEFIVKHNKTGGVWQDAAKELGYDIAKMEKCVKDGRATKVLKEDAALSEKVGATASPTIFIGGREYKGPRGSSDLFKAVCQVFGDKAPKVCQTNPTVLSRTDAGAGSGSCGGEKNQEVPKELVSDMDFTHTVIYDPKAFSSVEQKVLSQTTLYYPKAKIEKVTYDSAKGKKLIKKYNLKWLPAYIFPASISASNNFKQLQQVLIKTDDGAAYYLNPEQVGANINLERAKVGGELTIYYSPYSQKALDMIQDIFDLLNAPEMADAKSKIKVRFLPRAQIDRRGKLSSRNGAPELEEMERHAAILKLAPDKFLPYIKARAKNPTSTYWEDYLSEVSLDPGKIKAAAQSNEIASKLLSDAKDADAVKANPSFAILVENREVAEVTDKDEFMTLLEKVAK